MTLSLFEDEEPWKEELAPGASLLHHFASSLDAELWDALQTIILTSDFRHMTTSRGHSMSVGMTSCGAVGWVSDRKGYRYEVCDPQTNRPWPEMPQVFLDLASRAAQRGGFQNFDPDTCLINRYLPGAKMGLHQDKDEQDFSQPIVSVSLGLPATFQLGGLERTDKPRKIVLRHGDVVVWGGPSRLLYHGILTLKSGQHPLTGECRINLTFRKAIQ